MSVYYFYGHHKYVVIFVFYSKIQKKIKYCEYEEYIFVVWIMLIDHAKGFVGSLGVSLNFYSFLMRLCFF